MISMSRHLLLSMSTRFLHLKSELQLKSNKRDDDDHHDDDLVATLPVRLPLGEGVGGVCLSHRLSTRHLILQFNLKGLVVLIKKRPQPNIGVSEAQNVRRKTSIFKDRKVSDQLIPQKSSRQRLLCARSSQLRRSCSGPVREKRRFKQTHKYKNRSNVSGAVNCP